MRKRFDGKLMAVIYGIRPAVLYLSWLTGLFIFHSTIAALPVYVVKKTTAPLTIDGVLSDQPWSKLDSFSLVDCTSGAAASQRTDVKACWDAQNLYVAIDSRDKDVWATITAHDGNLYTEEMLEFFIDPDGDGKNYFEFEFNCLNALMDMFMLAPWGTTGGGGDQTWTASNSAFKVKVHGTLDNQNDVDTGFVLEARISWNDLQFNSVSAPKPKGGDRMAVNVYRGDGRQTKSYFCWSPVGGTLPGSFHSPQMFRSFEFSDSIVQSSTGVLSSPQTSGSFSGFEIACRKTRSGITVEYQAPTGGEVRILAISGKAVCRFPLIPNGQTTSIVITPRLPSGIYLIHLQTPQGEVTRKVIF